MLSGPAAADQWLAPLAGETSLLLAVSGGPDSTALMLLAAEWRRRNPQTAIAVATVDHGLREGSLEEAELVGEWARAQGFAHHLLRWRGPKPAARLQERARDARYDLLCACAKEAGPGCAIVLAHHADDQAETILFRLLRGSGVAGLAGMASSSRRDGVKLLRPLLGVAKSELEAVCNAAGHPFLRDPSNENDKFARVRLRSLKATLEAQGLHTPALLRLGRRAAQADEALNCCADRIWPVAVVVAEGRETRFDAAALREAPSEIVQRLLLRDFQRRGAKALRLERVERAASLIKTNLRARSKARITLGGLLIVIDDVSVTLTPAPPRFRGIVKFETKWRCEDDDL